MSITKLPNGRLRVQVYDPASGGNVSAASVVGEKPFTFPGTKQGRRDAQAYRERAREALTRRNERKSAWIKVGDFHARWKEDPLFDSGPRGPRKEGTRLHYDETVRPFVRAYADWEMESVDSEVVADWLAGGVRNHQAAALRVMWNDARSKKAGELVTHNPWSNLGIGKKSRAHIQPPTEEEIWKMVHVAKRLTCPSFASWLQFAAFTGMRPGEVDGLELLDVDFATNRIRVRQQWHSKLHKIQPPKNSKTRVITLTPPAREAIQILPRESKWAFTTMRGHNYTPSTRSYHWDRVRTAMNWLDRESRTVLYTATRHFAGWYLYDVLGLDSEDVAFQLGHEDGGELVRTLYGHKERKRALVRIDEAFERKGNVRPLRAVQ